MRLNLHDFLRILNDFSLKIDNEDLKEMDIFLVQNRDLELFLIQNKEGELIKTINLKGNYLKTKNFE